MVSEDDFRLVESPVPVPREGEVLIRNLWLSFDPIQRDWMSKDTMIPVVPLGDVMPAIAVGRVAESRLPDLRAGELVAGIFGWQDYVATDGKGVIGMSKLPPDLQPNLALSLFGPTQGLTAYFGVHDLAQVKEGETFVVSAAAGAVGSVAGQIARIKGARVIGITGKRAKRDWLLKEAGFHGAIDYRSEDVGARLYDLCPGGIDVYYDNVGGPLLDEVLSRINRHARIVLCGAISQYDTDTPVGLKNYFNLTLRSGQMHGFLVTDYEARYPEALEALARWSREGRLKHKEDVAYGLENAPKTLRRLFTGENFGKQLLKIDDPSASSAGVESQAPIS